MSDFCNYLSWTLLLKMFVTIVILFLKISWMAHGGLTSEGTLWWVCSLQKPNMLATSPPIYSIYNSSQSYDIFHQINEKCVDYDTFRASYFQSLYKRTKIIFCINLSIQMWSFDGVSQLLSRNPWKYYPATHPLENALPLWPLRLNH